MNNWRTRALLGASTAAVLIALVPFSGHRVSEREVLSPDRRRASRRLPGRAAAGRGQGGRNARRRTWRRLFAGGSIPPRWEAPGPRRPGSAAVEPFPLSPQIPSEAASSQRSSRMPPRKARLSRRLSLRRRRPTEKATSRRSLRSRPRRAIRTSALRWSGRPCAPIRIRLSPRSRLSPRPTPLGRGWATCASGRRPTSSFIPRPPRQCRNSSPPSRRSRAPESSPSRARRRRRGARTRRSGAFASCGATAISTAGRRARSCASSASCF